MTIHMNQEASKSLSELEKRVVEYALNFLKSNCDASTEDDLCLNEDEIGNLIETAAEKLDILKGNY